MIPASFEYHRPKSVAEAVQALSELGENSRVIAGGHSLIPLMKLRLAVPDHLIDLQGLDELRGISISGGTLTVGAMVTQHELIASEQLATACPILRETALQIADPQVRYCGTIGGNVANGDPGNDLPALMQCLNATYVLAGPSGTREVAARDFYEAAYVTALADTEILTSVRIAVPASGHGWAYQKQKRKIGDYATAAAAVILQMANGRCVNASLALSNLSETPLFVEPASSILVGTDVGPDVQGQVADAAKAIVEPAEDGRGPADFRRHVAGIMVRRALEAAKGRAV